MKYAGQSGGGPSALREAAQDSILKSYLDEGRSVSLNLFFILPLLLLYEFGIQRTGSDLRNAAEVILKDLRLFMGSQWLRYFHWFLIGLILFLLFRALFNKRLVVPYFGMMLVESMIFALILGPILAHILSGVLLDFPLTGGRDPDLSLRLLLSVGAGVYEELLFRFFLLGGLCLIFMRVFRAPVVYSATIAVLISSFLFAAYHHLGPHGQAFEPYPFFFRLGAGAVLGVVFITRGLGVAVYLHVFYDILRDIELVLQNA